MGFEEVVDQAEQMLARRGRLTHALLRRHFELEPDALADLVTELVQGRRIAVDENGAVLVWAGEEVTGSRPVERRQLTVVFCDLVDSTGLSSRLDPEDYGELLYRYQETCAGVVRQYGCHVAQVLGDGILIYAGYPAAFEDSAERAVLIGLGIVELMPALNAEIASSGERLAVRIGIHTGIVVVGNADRGAPREDLALGQTPNVAARLQSLAAPDTVIISAATHRLVAARFDAESIGLHRLKGITEPVTAHRVVAEASTNRRTVTTSASALPALVGRDAEFARLRETVMAAGHGDGAVALVTGEAGIGKTRLTQAVCAEADAAGLTVFECRASTHHQDTPLHVAAAVVERILGWDRRDPAATRLAALEAALASCPVDLAEAVALFAPALGLDPLPTRYPPLSLPPQRRRVRLAEVAMEVVGYAARSARLVIVVEDLQWLDPSSLELLARLVEGAAALPVLVVMTARPEFLPPWPPAANGLMLELDRLDAEAIERLIAQVAGPGMLPVDIVRLIAARADGVPLFVEEITRTVLEAGISASAIPASLHDSLMARLDRLESARTVALHAAVIGREFDLALLQAITPLEPAPLVAELDRLVEGGLLDYADGAGEGNYAFRHVLIRDVAYDSILKRTRRGIHRRIAEALELEFDDVRHRRPELLARHFSEAGMIEQALPYWRRAGEAADARFAYVEAGRHFARAQAALASLPETADRLRAHASIHNDLGRTRAIVGGWGAAEVGEAFTVALDLARRADASRQQFVALSGLRTHALMLGRLHQSRELSEELLALALTAGRENEIPVARGLLGDALYRLGRIEAAVTELELARESGFTGRSVPGYAGEDPGVHGLSHLALALWTRGRTQRALTCLDDAIALARGLAQPLSLAYALRFAADLHYRQRDPESVLDAAAELIPLAREQGLAHHAAIGAIFRGWARSAIGATTGIERKIRQGHEEMNLGLEAYRETGALVNLPFFLGLLAEAAAARAAIADGLALVTEALQCSARTGERWWDAELMRVRGRLLGSAGRDGAGDDATLPDSASCYRRALEVAREQRACALELRAAMALCDLESDDHASWQSRLAEVVEQFDERDPNPDLAAARTLLSATTGSG